MLINPQNLLPVVLFVLVFACQQVIIYGAKPFTCSLSLTFLYIRHHLPS